MSIQSLVKAKPRISLYSTGVVGMTVGFLAYSVVGNPPRNPTEAELRAAAIAIVPSNARECIASAQAHGDTLSTAKNTCAMAFPAPAPAPPVTEFSSCMLKGDEIVRESGSSSPLETFRLNLKACHEAFPQSARETQIAASGPGTVPHDVKNKESSDLADWVQKQATLTGLGRDFSVNAAIAQNQALMAQLTRLQSTQNNLLQQMQMMRSMHSAINRTSSSDELRLNSEQTTTMNATSIEKKQNLQSDKDFQDALRAMLPLSNKDIQDALRVHN